MKHRAACRSNGPPEWAGPKKNWTFCNNPAMPRHCASSTSARDFVCNHRGFKAQQNWFQGRRPPLGCAPQQVGEVDNLTEPSPA